jgi:hypothetical protein
MRTNNDIQRVLLSDHDQPQSVSRCQLLTWCFFGSVYLASVSLNFAAQTSESWPRYAFELTQVGAWMTIAQHSLHPHSPLKPYLPKRKPAAFCKWFANDNYHHDEGFSNLALAVEMVIPALYWALAFRFMNLSTIKEYINAACMHGLITTALFADYLLNARPFHLRHNLLNLTGFMAAYTLWNFVGQKIQAEPVYPMIDWEKQPLNGLLVLAIGCSGGLVAAGLLKAITYARRKCKVRHATMFYSINPDSADQNLTLAEHV